MALPVRDQITYWSIAAAVLLVVLWFLGDVLLPFILGGAIAYFLDPVADRLERLGLSRVAATGVITICGVLAFVLILWFKMAWWKMLMAVLPVVACASFYLAQVGRSMTLAPLQPPGAA